MWQSEGGAGGYDGLLAVGDRLEGVVPGLLGGGNLRAFYRVDERLGLVGGETVLDLACGPGTLTRRLARAVGRDGLVIAADLSEAMLARAARSTPFACVDFARIDAMYLPLRDACVDAVSCSLCLHLVPDLGTALEEMARVLRPGAPAALRSRPTRPGSCAPSPTCWRGSGRPGCSGRVSSPTRCGPAAGPRCASSRSAACGSWTRSRRSDHGCQRSVVAGSPVAGKPVVGPEVSATAADDRAPHPVDEQQRAPDGRDHPERREHVARPVPADRHHRDRGSGDARPRRPGPPATRSASGQRQQRRHDERRDHGDVPARQRVLRRLPSRGQHRLEALGQPPGSGAPGRPRRPPHPAGAGRARSRRRRPAPDRPTPRSPGAAGRESRPAARRSASSTASMTAWSSRRPASSATSSSQLAAVTATPAAARRTPTTTRAAHPPGCGALPAGSGRIGTVGREAIVPADVMPPGCPSDLLIP